MISLLASISYQITFNLKPQFCFIANILTFKMTPTAGFTGIFLKCH